MFTGVVRDLSARKALEREVLEVATVEQQRIGQELHDTSAQELTALGLLADSLVAALEETPGQARIAGKMAEGLKRVLGQVRAFSRGLIRVHVDAEGLMAALAELAAQTTELHGVACTFDCRQPVQLADNHTATQLYCIAREAVTNALKHAQARNITISLASDDGALVLSVVDDGVGFSEPPVDTRGMGLKTMRYRVGLIDAHLAIVPREGGGTAVTCKCNKEAPRAQE
jgi:signal transduction histidine kinase